MSFPHFDKSTVTIFLYYSMISVTAIKALIQLWLDPCKYGWVDYCVTWIVPVRLHQLLSPCSTVKFNCRYIRCMKNFRIYSRKKSICIRFRKNCKNALQWFCIVDSVPVRNINFEFYLFWDIFRSAGNWKSPAKHFLAYTSVVEQKVPAAKRLGTLLFLTLLAPGTQI